MKPSPPFILVPVEPIGNERRSAYVDWRNPRTGQLTGRWMENVTFPVYPDSAWGKKLRALREGRGVAEQHITKAGAARALGMTPADISGLEQGRVTLASDDEWNRLLNHLRPSRIS